MDPARDLASSAPERFLGGAIMRSAQPPWFYADRALGRDRDHRGLDRALTPRRAIGAGSGAALRSASTTSSNSGSLFTITTARSIRFPWGDGPWWIEWSAHTLLLPYMEQGPIYNAINFGNGFFLNGGPSFVINYPANTTAVLHGDLRVQLSLRHRSPDRPQRTQQLHGQFGLGT